MTNLSPSELASLSHFVDYGQPGPDSSAPPTPPAKATSWETKPFVAPNTSPWNLPVTPPQLSGLKHGFIPREMEDKWFVYADEEDGVWKVHFFRSWTGMKILEMRVEVEGEGGNDRDGERVGGRIQSLRWESDKSVINGQDENMAKETAREVCRWVLGVELLAES